MPSEPEPTPRPVAVKRREDRYEAWRIPEDLTVPASWDKRDCPKVAGCAVQFLVDREQQSWDTAYPGDWAIWDRAWKVFAVCDDETFRRIYEPIPDPAREPAGRSAGEEQ